MPGGVLVRDANNGAILAAVGAAGGASEEDEACVQRGDRSVPGSALLAVFA